MTRAEIVAVFEGIADIMQIRGEDARRVQMYRGIARILDTIQEDIQLLYDRNELIEIPGIGPSTMEKIGELIDTGQCQYYEELKASIPSGVLDLLSIPGVGPSTAARLYQELNIDSLEALQQAIDDQKLRNLKRMGKKTEEKIKAGLEAVIRYRQYSLMSHALPPAKAVVEVLSSLEDVSSVSLVGGLRRRTETVRNAQILAACAISGKDNCATKVRDALAGMECIESVDDDWTEYGGSARLVGDMELQVKLVDSANSGAALLHLTGSEDHVAELNHRAVEAGLEPLQAGGGQSREGSYVSWAKGKPEEEIYAALGMPFIVPELREGRGEVQAALTGQLPQLIDMDDIRGDLHVHSTWSDGNETIEKMAEAARELGYEYVGVCDHSISSKIANGLDVERILNKMIELREINEKIPGIEILMGAEVDILRDGGLDYPDGILEKLDVVIAAIHSSFGMGEAEMTERIIAAIENEFTHIISHPTGRLLNRREPYRVNVDALIDAAAENNTSLEINAYPDRLDLKDVHSRLAKERGVMLSINTDAHGSADLGLMIYGIYTARRGWLEKKDVLNTLPLVELMKWLQEK
jgi:DNA polymerase (family 10)